MGPEKKIAPVSVQIIQSQAVLALPSPNRVIAAVRRSPFRRLPMIVMLHETLVQQIRENVATGAPRKALDPAFHAVSERTSGPFRFFPLGQPNLILEVPPLLHTYEPMPRF